MSDIIHVVIVLSVPFLLGVAFGVEIVRRRDPLERRIGRMVLGNLRGVCQQHTLIGNGVTISKASEAEYKGQMLQVICRLEAQ